MAKQKYRDPRGPHLRVYHELMFAPAYRVLSRSAKALFFDMRAKLNGSNNGNIEATLNKLKHVGWTSGHTIATALYELLALGFIVRTRSGSYAIGKGQCALYGFTDIEILEQKGKCDSAPAAFNHRAYESVGHAQQALKEGVERLRAFSKKLDEERKNLALVKKKALCRKRTELKCENCTERREIQCKN